MKIKTERYASLLLKEINDILYNEIHDEDIIGMHPNDNTTSLWLKVKDLKDIIKEHGNEVYEAEL